MSFYGRDYGQNLEKFFKIDAVDKEKNQIYSLNIEDLMFENEKYELPDFLNKTRWISKFYFDYAYTQDVQEYFLHEPLDTSKIDLSLYQYEDLLMNYFEPINFSFGRNYFYSGYRYQAAGINCLAYIESIDENKITYTVIKTGCGIDKGNINRLAGDYRPLYEKKVPYNIILVNDGDYLNLYVDTISDKNLLFELVKADDETYSNLKLFCKVDPYCTSYDLSKIKYPKHADGSCDYDVLKAKESENKRKEEHKSIVEKTVQDDTKQSKTFEPYFLLTRCNLKLRVEEGLSSNVIAVMKKHTEVKVLEHGKEEDLDGMENFNWLKVEVQRGAEDVDGNPIKRGTIGWCYGGYLY